MKITVVGGGSFQWTMGFARQFVDSPHFRDATLVLMDVDKDALDLTGECVATYSRAHGEPIKIERTLELAPALDGADFVIVSIATGGLDAMEQDLKATEKYGIWHTVGDTVGPAGWSRAIRSIPVFNELAAHMNERCPLAWMINVSNPLTVLTRTPTKTHGIRCIGMCPGVGNHAKTMAELAGLGDAKTLNFTATGIDHGSFLTAVDADGVDVIARLKELGYCRNDGVLPTEAKTEDPFAGTAPCRAIFALWHELGYLPGLNDRHIVENFPWFLAQPSESDIPFNLKRTTIERREGKMSRRNQLERYLQTSDESVLKGLGHGDDPVAAVIEALLGHRTVEYGANYANVGQIPQLPRDAVVETHVMFDGAGVHPLPSPMPELLVPYILPTVLRQEAVIDIALGGTFDELVALVLGDPLCSRMKLVDCRAMLQELLEANRSYIRNPALLRF